MKKVIKKRKSERELTRFVWSRREEYDYALLQKVQARNPFSFKKPRPIWADIAKTLMEGDLKMRVTERSCRDRVNDLLRKHRREEASIIRSTGATDDEYSEMKKLLVIIDDMESTKPTQKVATMYVKKKKTDGEKIRDAVLANLSDSESDDYVNNKYPRNDSAKKSLHNEEMEIITSVNGLFTDGQMSLAEEEESLRLNQIQVDSWQDMPSTSRDNRFSIPVADLPFQGYRSQSVDQQVVDSSDDQEPSTASRTQSVVQQVIDSSDDEEPSMASRTQSAVQHSSGSSVDQRLSTASRSQSAMQHSSGSSVDQRPSTAFRSQSALQHSSGSSVDQRPSTASRSQSALQHSSGSSVDQRPSTTSRSQSALQQVIDSSVDQQPSTASRSQSAMQHSSGSSVDQRPSTASPSQSGNLTVAPQSSSASSQPQSNDSNKDNRISNPKKDLVTFLEKKSTNELEIRKEEVRLRELEVVNKTEELRILRLKTEAEVAEKKEELSILRIKTEAETVERKQIQELLISLIQKNN